MSGHHPVLTTHRRLGPGPVLRRGSVRPYRRMGLLDGEPHVVRHELLGGTAGLASARGGAKPLFAFAHVTDLQLPDVQSPARFEFFNRELSDPRFAKLVPVQRPQESLTARAMQAMVATLNRVHAAGAPVTGLPLDLVVTTGDAIDNAQWNELQNWFALLDGGRVRPGSGGPAYEGVQSPSWPDGVFWCPDGPSVVHPADLWCDDCGFGHRPGLLEAALADFEAAPLDVPWLACYGNHEALVQGVGVVTPELARAMTGARKPTSLRAEYADPDVALEVFTAQAHLFFGGDDVTVTADADRRPVGRAEFVAAHFAGGAPLGHGFTEVNRRDGTAYYAYDHGPVRFIGLDTTANAGASDGCLDADQLRWLTDRLIEVHATYEAADGSVQRTTHEDRLVVLFSHHGMATLTNTRDGWVDEHGDPVFGGPELERLLHRFGNVVLWLNGHTHVNGIRAHPRPGAPGRGFWEVTTCAIMDWPCQARLVEFLDAGDGLLHIACTMLDHEGEVVPADGPAYTPADLAGLHRELAGNVFWHGFDSGAAGLTTDRNVVLPVLAPF
ncbi:TIGR03767 family metallophosphoesterase [Spongisporangium articulatum]|uniref:TIGR03767 family metallophosphoesterase n=1 Tax=Spongisporangium articulatum TaxID=3362603 RepID=A0ABW8AGT9_9ACTN